MSKPSNKMTSTEAIHKLAILSDVHGNLPALEAVITDAKNRNVDAFWNLGDFIGYGPFVDEVIELLFDTCSAQVIGNYDLRVLKFPKKKQKWKLSKKKEKYLAFKWAWQRLSKNNCKKLEQLPRQKRQTLEGVKFLLTHGGPETVDEAIGVDTPEKRFKQLANMAGVDVILCGHTHLPFAKTVDLTTFINPGSVGRPEGDDPDRAGGQRADQPGDGPGGYAPALLFNGRDLRVVRRHGRPGQAGADR
jgi:putative phosphoesterase